MSNNFSIDEIKIASYLASNIEGFKGPLTATKFPGGQSNPTYKIEAASGNYVLRRKPPGQLLKSAHAVDREYRVIKALRDTEVPVAEVYHLCEDDSIIGSMFYVMEFVEGRVFWDAALPDFSKEQRKAIYTDMNRVLAALHSANIEKAGLSDYGKPGNYFERQIGRWTKQYKAAEIDKIPEMDALIEWLPNNMPEDDGKVALAHGDFRLDNMMFAPDQERVVALVDWELSTLGHPYADLAYQCMQLRMPRTAEIPGLAGLDLPALGIPTEEEYVAMYCERMGIPNIPNWNFYLVFSIFRLAAIVQGVKKRAVDGNASSEKAHKMGEMVKPLAQLAMSLC